MRRSVLEQELFVISEQVQSVGVHQDQMVMEPRTTFLRFSNKEYEVVNLSCFDCTALIPVDAQKDFKQMILANPHLEPELICHGTLVQKLKLHWIRPSNEVSDVAFKFEVHEETISIERIQGLRSSAKVISEQGEYGAILAALPPVFKALVFEFKDLLMHLKTKIDKLETEIARDNFQAEQEYRLGIAQIVVQYLEDLKIPKIHAEAAQFLQTLTPEQLKTAMEFARAQIGPLVYGAPFASRAYFKPRGYAGDYEMMNHLYRDELVGKSLFDQCMHKYFVQESAGAAVKNRGYYLADKLKNLFESTPQDEPLKILSVASGPAMEQQLFLKQETQFHSRAAHFTCLDADEESLKHGQRQLLTAQKKLKTQYQFKFKNMAIRNVIARGLPEQDYDLIYSAGLFDYFTDQVARAAAKQFITSVKPGGKVIIGNYSKDNLSASFMEMVLDWKLIYRSEEDLLRIFQGLGSKIWVEKEPLGINLFVVIQK